MLGAFGSMLRTPKPRQTSESVHSENVSAAKVGAENNLSNKSLLTEGLLSISTNFRPQEFITTIHNLSFEAGVPQNILVAIKNHFPDLPEGSRVRKLTEQESSQLFPSSFLPANPDSTTFDHYILEPENALLILMDIPILKLKKYTPLN